MIDYPGFAMDFDCLVLRFREAVGSGVGGDGGDEVLFEVLVFLALGGL